ncbi:MAG: alpha/beta hydrolase, partial [Thermoanaerobaculia bacterium]|nr:alpha/beta hydrolase [Thermoanaerobaculia bacterium]
MCLSGLWSGPSSGGDLLVVVHGLGGCAESFYARRAAAAAEGAGVGCLRLNLRGADERGEDIYHAGLWSDLAAVVESPAFDGYERLLVLGYSLGGHLA